MKTFWTATLVLTSMGWAIAQEVPPVPKPQESEEPTLEATMKFIQDKLPGRVNYMVYVHDNLAGTDASIKRSFALGDVSADASRCYIGFHERFDNGKNISEHDGELFLRQVREVVLTQMDQMTAGRRQGWPPGTKHQGRSSHLPGNSQDRASHFYDDSLADRMFKALQHAMELCGGGHQEPF